MSEFISMPKIEEHGGELYKIKLEGEVLRQFKAYELAYEQAYGKKTNSESLISYLIEFGLSKDTKFKKWYKANHKLFTAKNNDVCESI